MGKQYSNEFKMEAVKRIEKTREPMRKVADELGIRPSTMHGWVNKYKKSPTTPFIGSGHLSPEDEKLYKLEKENRDLREENDILKKAAAYSFYFLPVNIIGYQIFPLLSNMKYPSNRQPRTSAII